MSGKRGMGVSVGGSSIVMIFVVLAMTTFGTLALLSARADLRFATRTADSAAGYYQADCAAQEWLAGLDAVIAQARLEAEESPGDEWLTDKARIYYNTVVGKLVLMDGIGLVSDSSTFAITVTYEVEMANGKRLEAAVAVNGYDSAQRYTIESWQVTGGGLTDISGDDVQLLDPDSFNFGE